MSCAYCGRQLGNEYEAWLDLSIDHVVPGGTVKQFGWPREWIEDITNLVTCCRACNEFLNGYRVQGPAPPTVDDFFAARDVHFIEKRSRVIERHRTERAW
jgi:5-methylcytosine-specific restriction endonuclease McrA